jgi:hypothetical protein
MNNETINVNRASGAAVGFIVASGLFIALAVIVKFSVPVPAIDADRAAGRAKDLAEIRATENTDLTQLGWIDQQRGVVRLPIVTAMRLAAQEWKNPAQARADLIAREDKASAPAPAAPAKPNPFD